MVAGLPLRNTEQLEVIFWEVADPTSPSYLVRSPPPPLPGI